MLTSPGASAPKRALPIGRFAGRWRTQQLAASLPVSMGECSKHGRVAALEDCSAFISMAWGLNASYVTSTLPSVATAITKSSLQPGDMLDPTSSHAVLFVGWYDEAHTPS